MSSSSTTTDLTKFVTLCRRGHDCRLIIIDPAGRRHSFHIGEDGLILKELASGTRELIQYDYEGRCLRKVVESANGERRSRSYHYSAAGDLSRVEDCRRGWAKYHYDAGRRLKVAEREDGRNELYAHDAAGNLILQPGLDGVRVGPGNRLKQANGERFHFDHRDNSVLRQSENRTASYEYDCFDQLVGMSLNGREWRAEYDAIGRRVRKYWHGQTSEYYWDDDRLAAEVRSDGSVRVYVHVDERALVPFLYVDYANLGAEPESGKVKYLFTNHLGAPERIEDESGRTIWRGEVSPYGAVRVEVGGVDEINLRFPGHYYDAETGLHYNRFRYYDPALGCYLQSDPLGIVGGLNLQAYLANPLTDVDVLGLSAGHSRGGGRPKGKGQSDGPIKPARQRSPRAAAARTPSRRSPARWSDARLQRAVDEIHHAQYRGDPFGTKNPMTVSVTPNGRVVVSQVSGLPGPRARAKAEEIFKGHPVEFVGGGESANAPGVNGHHAEARGIHHLGEEARGTRQASSHYACPSCEGRQNTAGVNNTTGFASEHGGKITRDYIGE